MSTASEAGTRRSRDQSKRTLLIDTDVHDAVRSALDLMPYLDPFWQEYWREGSRNVRLPGSGFPYAMPGHTRFRADWVLEDGTAGTDIDALRRHLFEEESISVAILNNHVHGSTTPVSWEYAAALARAYNDWQIDRWLDQDSRILGSVYVLPYDPAFGVQEIERVASHPQIVQVFLPTVTDRQYGDPFYRPIFEAALRNGLVVTLHHGVHTQTLLGYPRYFTEWHALAAPQAAMNQLLSMICNGLFDRYPELKVVFLEAGVGWVPWFMRRCDQQYMETRSEIPWVKRLPSEHMRDNVRLSTQPLADLTPRQFAEVVEMAEAERMFMYSSDYPHYDADNVDVVLPSTLPEELRRRVRYENALETYPRLRALVPV